MDNSINYTEVKPHKKSKYFYFLLGLIAFHIISNITWIILNNQPPTWDAALHTMLSLQMYGFVKEALLGFKITEFLSISNYYPPFTHIFGVFMISILGYSFKILQFSGTIFLSLAIFFIYLFTKNLFKNERIAFFTSFFFSFFILVFQQSRYHMLDIPLTALIFISLYFLIKSENLINEKYSLLFFTFAALATTAKWYALIFLFFPVFFLLVEAFINKSEVKKIVKNILLGSILFLIITLPWYVVNLKFLAGSIKVTSTPELSDPQSFFSIDNLLFYLKQTIMFQTSLLGFIFFIVSIYFLIKNKLKNSGKIVIFTLIFTYFIFTLIGNKNIRFLIPIMPFIAMVMAYGADWILNKGKFLTNFVFSATLTYLVLSYFILSFGFPVYPKYKYAINFPILKWIDVYYLHTYPVKVLYEPNPKLPYLDIIKDIDSIKRKNIRILMLADTEYINNGIIDPKLYSNVIKVKKNFDFINYDILSKVKDTQFFLDENVDVILISIKYLGLHEGIREYEDLNRIHRFVLSGELENFEKVKEYQLVGDEYHPNDTIILMKKSF